jgi:hypothetical protein
MGCSANSRAEHRTIGWVIIFWTLVAMAAAVKDEHESLLESQWRRAVRLCPVSASQSGRKVSSAELGEFRNFTIVLESVIFFIIASHLAAALLSVSQSHAPHLSAVSSLNQSSTLQHYTMNRPQSHSFADLLQ